MKPFPGRRKFILLLTSALAWWVAPGRAQSSGPAPGSERKKVGGGRGKRASGAYVLPPELAEFDRLSLVLGRATDRAVTISVLAREEMEGLFEYGVASGYYDRKSPWIHLPAGAPVEWIFADLEPDTAYYYRLSCRPVGAAEFAIRRECRFHTQHAPHRTFTFAIQGDSHPERPQMSDPALYARTLRNAAADQPDFYLCMGDDFSVAPIREITPAAVGARYILQRPFLGLVAQSSPLFLLNGNHEQASLFNYNQRDERHDVAVLAQQARNHYYPTPSPGAFYSGDTAELKSIGQLKDYCAWTWGDALFVVLDNYWQSPAQVDSGFRDEAGGNKSERSGRGDRDWWGLTLGDAQYQWFKRTLEESAAKYKFVFAHHVLGSGRGGVDEAHLYEWGGRNRRGQWEFAERRPGWELPVHQLMVKHGVTIFFQGHDHLYARQELDGVVYQEVPMPCDPGYVAYNEDRYGSGVKLPNSGHLRVTVSPDEVKVDYVRCYLAKDETEQRKTGDIAHSYTLKPRIHHV